MIDDKFISNRTCFKIRLGNLITLFYKTLPVLYPDIVNSHITSLSSVELLVE
jgi:hypothetical protein